MNDDGQPKTGRFVSRKIIPEIELSHCPEIIEWTKESICHGFADVLVRILSDGRKYQIVFLALTEQPADPSGIEITLHADIVLMIASDARVGEAVRELPTIPPQSVKRYTWGETTWERQYWAWVRVE